MCTELIKASGIKQVIYSGINGEIIKKKSHELIGAHVSKGIKKMRSDDSAFVRKTIYKITKLVKR